MTVPAAPPSFGAVLLPDGSTRFRLWAPAQAAVAVAIEGGGTVPMTGCADGWFEAVASCGAGTRYRYRLSDGMQVPDPASRAQAGDVHDASVVVDPSAYRWRNQDWRGRPWNETVLYEVHAGALGGFSGIAAALPKLQQLGVTAIELMPINDFPGERNWGYDGVLPYAPDAAYGTPDELKALVDAAHDRGMMIFLDVVYNHFGPDGNYLSLYAPGFFREDIHTPWGAAIDFRRPEVRRFFTENVLYWLNEFRFDGLRFDAVHAISEQDWLDEMAAAARASMAADRQIHLVLEHHNAAGPLRRQVDAQWNDDGHNVLHVLLTDEDGGYYADYAEDTAAKLARCLEQGWAFQGEVSAYLGHARGEPAADLPPTAHVLFLQNHDQVGNRAFGERLTVLTEPATLEAAIALLMLCPQIPMLFMGEETASRSPFLFFTDHHGELAEAVRKGRRAEFAKFADFADPEKRERIPDPNALATFTASVPLPDPDAGQARFAFYQHLIALRMRHVAPHLAAARGAGAAVLGPKAVRADWVLGNGRRLIIATNLAPDPVAFVRPSGTRIFSSSDDVTDRLPGRCTAVYLETSQ